MVNQGHKILDSNVLIMGYTFKENCPDFRNTKVNDLVNELKKYGMSILIQDHLCDLEKVKNINGQNIVKKINKNQKFDCLILSVAHKEYLNLESQYWNSLINKNGIIFDLKGIVPKESNPIRL